MSSKKPQKKTPQVKPKVTAPPDIFKIGIGLAVLMAVILYYYSSSFNFIQDDSFITYRYVKNFTEGNGLVFNIGEKVEGYTCFLWVILLGGIKKLGFDFIKASQTLGIIASMFALLFTYLISVRIFPKDRDTIYNLSFGLIAVILTALNGSNAYWAVSGMETGLFTLLVTAGVYLYLKEYRDTQAGKTIALPYSSIIFLLAALTRPEGNLIFAVTVLHKIIVTWRSAPAEGKTKMQELFAKNNLIWLGMYFVPALLYMAWRYSYYGYLFPNTFYAKTGSSWVYFQAGLDYFWLFMKSYGGFGIFAAIALLTLRSKERFNEYLYLVMIFFIFSLYVIYVGGDVLRPNRFFVPILPVFFILVQEGLSQLISMMDTKKSFAFGGILGLAFAAIFSYYTYQNEYEQIKQYAFVESGLVKKMTIAGGWLKEKQTQAGRPLVVAATTIGAVSYYSDVTLIDMLGLTDKEVAHNPQPIDELMYGDIGWKERNYNVPYILSRKPDYIYFSTGMKPSAFAERGLFTADEFMKYYYPYYVNLKQYSFTDVFYKRKTDEEVKQMAVLPPNPNYKKSFVNLFTQGLNTIKDKTKLQEAIGLLEQSASQGPSGWGAPYQVIGDLYLQQNDPKGFDYYKKALSVDDYNVMAHYGLYQFYMENNDTVGAKNSVDKIRKYSPELIQ